jgi:hypothetical protein
MVILPPWVCGWNPLINPNCNNPADLARSSKGRAFHNSCPCWEKGLAELDVFKSCSGERQWLSTTMTTVLPGCLHRPWKMGGKFLSGTLSEQWWHAITHLTTKEHQSHYLWDFRLRGLKCHIVILNANSGLRSSAYAEHEAQYVAWRCWKFLPSSCLWMLQKTYLF